ncbi:hypothetical protein GCM10009558_078910 [Virgisporangium aurantiacum]
MAGQTCPRPPGHGELLPLACADANLVVFNATRVIDALDEERSDVLRLGPAQILDIRRAAFRGELLTGSAVFKIPQMLFGPLYFTSTMVERIRATGLHSGVTFREVGARPGATNPGGR